MPRPGEEAYDGLSQVAHAIRRSTALTVAMSILPQDATVEDLKEQAEDLARWIGGSALQQAQEGQEKPPGEPLGVSWHDRDDL